MYQTILVFFVRGVHHIDLIPNARMESFFATLKKECIYKVKTETLKMEVVKSMVFRFIEIHYNRKRIYTTNDGYPPLMKRRQYERDQLSKVV